MDGFDNENKNNNDDDDDNIGQSLGSDELRQRRGLSVRFWPLEREC